MQTADLGREVNTGWSRFLAPWSLFTSLVYVSLVVAILTLVMPAARPNPLGDSYFELIAAGRAPILYRSTIILDATSWIALAGLLAGFAALLRQKAPVRGILVMLLASGLSVGFVGACLRLAGTSYLADKYFSASGQQGAVVQSYDYLLHVIDILFSAGGVLGGIALLLIASAARTLSQLPLWSTVLVGIAGLAHLAKGAGELATGADLGPFALLANALMVVALVAIARKLYSLT
jgi:hypothetical protein